LKSNNRK